LAQAGLTQAGYFQHYQCHFALFFGGGHRSKKSQSLGLFTAALSLRGFVGLFFNWFKITLPAGIFNPLVTIGNLTIPLMLLSLGHRLHDFKIEFFWGSLWPTLLRCLGGFLLALAFVYFFKIEGLTQKCHFIGFRFADGRFGLCHFGKV